MVTEAKSALPYALVPETQSVLIPLVTDTAGAVHAFVAVKEWESPVASFETTMLTKTFPLLTPSTWKNSVESGMCCEGVLIVMARAWFTAAVARLVMRRAAFVYVAAISVPSIASIPPLPGLAVAVR